MRASVYPGNGPIALSPYPPVDRLVPRGAALHGDRPERPRPTVDTRAYQTRRRQHVRFHVPALARGWLAAAGQLEFVRSSAILQAAAQAVCRPRFRQSSTMHAPSGPKAWIQVGLERIVVRPERRHGDGQSDPDLSVDTAVRAEHITDSERSAATACTILACPRRFCWRVGGWPAASVLQHGIRQVPSAILQALGLCMLPTAAAVCRPRFERNRDCTQGLDRPQDSRLNYQSVNPPGATSDKINREEWDDEVAYPETALRVRASFGCATDQLGDADSDLRHRLTFRCCWEACSAIPPSKECWSCGPNPMDRIHHEAKLLLMAFIVAFALTTLVYVYGVDADAATVPCTADTL